MTWSKVADVSTPWVDIEAQIAEHTAIAIAALRAQLDADPDLSPGERAAILAKLAPVFGRRTRQALEAAWPDIAETPAARH